MYSSVLSFFIVQGENKPTWNSEGNSCCKKGAKRQFLVLWEFSKQFIKLNLMDFILHKSLEFAFFPFILPPVLLWKPLTATSLAIFFSFSLIHRPFFKLFSHLPSPRLFSSLLTGFACSLVSAGTPVAGELKLFSEDLLLKRFLFPV